MWENAQEMNEVNIDYFLQQGCSWRRWWRIWKLEDAARVRKREVKSKKGLKMFVDWREGAVVMWEMGNVRGMSYNSVAWLRKIFEGEQIQVPRNIWERKEIAGVSLQWLQAGLKIYFCYVLVAIIAGILFENRLFLEDYIQKINKNPCLPAHTVITLPLPCKTRPKFPSSGKMTLFGVIKKKTNQNSFVFDKFKSLTQ